MQGDAASLLAQDRLAHILGVRLVDDGDSVTVEVTVADHHLNAADGVHGGVLFSLADVALALVSNRNAETAYAVETHMSFVRRAGLGDTLTAKPERESASRSMEWYRIPVINGDGDPVALFRGMVYRPRSH